MATPEGTVGICMKTVLCRCVQQYKGADVLRSLPHSAVSPHGKRKSKLQSKLNMFQCAETGVSEHRRCHCNLLHYIQVCRLHKLCISISIRAGTNGMAWYAFGCCTTWIQQLTQLSYRP